MAAVAVAWRLENTPMAVAGFRLMVAVAGLVASDEVAVTVAVAGLGSVAGAV